jgi:hypothetical protein
VCFQQDTLCYSSSPPTGSKNCPIWEAKCDGIQAACNAGNFNGPPNQGKDLNPTTTTSYSIPGAAAESTGVYLKALSPFTLAASSSSTSTQVPTYAPDTTALTSLVTDTFSQTSSGSILLPSVVASTLSESTSTNTMTTLATISSTISQSPSTAFTSTKASLSTTGIPEASQNTTLPISIDATCGSVSNHTCLGSAFGSCCSQWNWCGITDAYCGQGCQLGYGTCGKQLALKEKKSAHLKRHRGH